MTALYKNGTRKGFLLNFIDGFSEFCEHFELYNIEVCKLCSLHHIGECDIPGNGELQT